MTARNRSLDVLRGIAVLLVLGRHFGSAPWSPIGWWGVDLFFVLSGFLISGLLFQDHNNLGRIRLGHFWIRRGWKIWPAFFVYLVAARLFLKLCGIRTEGHPVLVSSLFLSDYFHSRLGPFFGHTWSLSVEEHFYLLLPVALIFLSRNQFATVPYVSLAALVICPVLRWVAPLEIADYATHTRIDGLLAGVGLGYLYHFKQKTFASLSGTSTALPILAVCAVVAGCLGDPIYHQLPATLAPSCLAIGFSFLVAWSVARAPHRTLRPIAQIGVYSYSIYLWHTLVATVCRSLIDREWMLVPYMATAIGLGICMSRFVELPCLEVRDSLTGKQPSPVSTPQLRMEIHYPAQSLSKTIGGS
jgi:peptidoglycan/LPS O-acetylase OafA/YrhL